MSNIVGLFFMTLLVVVMMTVTTLLGALHTQTSFNSFQR